MRGSVIAVAVCGLFLCAFVIPAWGGTVTRENPEYSGWFWPWLIFAWLVAIPCFAILIHIWKVAGAVEREAVFTMQTAKWVKSGAVLLLADAVLLFVGNVVLFMLSMNLIGVVFLSIMIDILAVTLALFAAVLSRYLTKAALLQEESEGTL
jgi:hypothetical protein